MLDANVLIVDDEDCAVEILSRILKSRGHRAVGAATADAAVAALRGTRFDFVLLDVIMPGRTGLQVLPELCRLTKAPIHVISGQSASDVWDDARLLGAAGFFSKPLDIELVVATISGLPQRAP